VIGPHSGEDPGLRGAALGALVGVTLGIGAGVSGVAHVQGERASFARASMGAVGGLLLVGALSEPLGLDPDYAPLWICLGTIPPATAVLVNRAGGHVNSRTHVVARPRAGRRLGLGASLGF
jgi:hypothetical protein